MNKLSNKGQTLVLFVVLLPVFLLMAAVIIDLGLARNNKIKLDNITKSIVNYGIKNIDNDPYEEMVRLLYKNDSSIDKFDIKIDTDNKRVMVKTEKNSPGIFSNVVNKERYKEESYFIGYVSNDKIIIEKGE